MKTELEKAKMWKVVFQAAWIGGLILFMISGLAYAWWSPLPPSTMTMVTSAMYFLLGVIFLVQSFFEGRYDALASSPVSVEKYSARKTFAVRSTILFGLIFALLGSVTIWAILQGGALGGTWLIAGMIFFFSAFVGNSYLWEIFFLKRLGKVETT